MTTHIALLLPWQLVNNIASARERNLFIINLALIGGEKSINLKWIWIFLRATQSVWTLAGEQTFQDQSREEVTGNILTVGQIYQGNKLVIKISICI